MPYLFETIGDISIDRVEFKGGHLSDIKVKMPQPKDDHVKFKLSDDGNVIELKATDM